MSRQISERQRALGDFSQSVYIRGALSSGTTINAGFECSNVADFNWDYNQPRSFVFEFKAIPYNWPAGAQTLLYRRDSGTPYRAQYMYVTHTGQVVWAFYSDYPSTIELRAVALAGSLNFSKWNKVVLTYDGSGDGEGIKVYINGALQPTNTIGVGSTMTHITDLIATPFITTTFRGLGGFVTQWGAYERVLTQDEINDFQSRNKIPVTPYSWFDADDYTTAGNWVDTSSTYTLTPLGTPETSTEWLPSKERNVVTYKREVPTKDRTKSVFIKGNLVAGTTGNSGFLTQDIADYNFDWNEARTFFFKFRPTDYYFTAGEQYLFYQKKLGAAQAGQIMWITPRGDFSWRIYDGTATYHLFLVTNFGYIKFNRWNTLVFSYDGSGNSSGAKVFVNGTECGYFNRSGTSTATHLTDDTTRLFHVSNRGVNAFISDFGVIARVATDEEIQNFHDRNIVPNNTYEWFSSETYTDGAVWVGENNTHNLDPYGTPTTNTEILPNKDRVVVV